MNEIKATSLKNVAALKRYLKILPDEQLLKVDIELISDPDLSHCAQHQLASFMHDEYRPYSMEKNVRS